MIFRSTYPRHSFDGITPSPIRNVVLRMWSATTRMDVSEASFAPYLMPVSSLMRRSSGWKQSVS